MLSSALLAVIQFGLMAGIAVVGGAFALGAWLGNKVRGKEVRLLDNIPRPK
jgi:hypothetical protein